MHVFFELKLVTDMRRKGSKKSRRAKERDERGRARGHGKRALSQGGVLDIECLLPFLALYRRFLSTEDMDA